MAADRRALLVATYGYRDAGLRQLTAPEHDAEALGAVLEDPEIAGFDVTVLVNEPHHVVGEAIADFYGHCRRDDLTLLYFTGHGLKDDAGRLYLAMTDTRRDALMFTALSAAQISDAMDACRSRRKVLVLDCCYSGAFPAGRTPKADEGVQTLERFQGKGRAVLTASDATQYAFEGDSVAGDGTRSLFTRYLVEAIRTGEGDLDGDGDIALDELYSYVHERVVAEMPRQRPKKQEDVDGRILIARNVHWKLPEHVRHAIESPIAAQRLGAVDALAHLHRTGNDLVRTAVLGQLTALAEDDSRSVSTRAGALLRQLTAGGAPGQVPGDVPGQVPGEVRGEVPGAPPTGSPEPPPPADPEQRRPTDPEPPREAVPARPREPVRAAPPPTTAGASADAGARAHLLLVLLVAAGLLLGASRLVVFEAVNTYQAASIGFGTAPWALGIGLPVLLAAVLVLAPVERRVALPVVTGLLVGAALAVADQTVAFLAGVAADDYGYAPGAGFWSSVAGAVLLLLAVVRAAPGPAAWAAPATRADWAAVLGLVVVLAAAGVWISRYQPDTWVWAPALAPCLLLAGGCLAMAVLEWTDVQRRIGLCAVTVYGGYVVADQVHRLVTQSTWTDAPDAVAALGCALVMVAAAQLCQRFRSGAPPARAA